MEGRRTEHSHVMDRPLSFRSETQSAGMRLKKVVGTLEGLAYDILYR